MMLLSVCSVILPRMPFTNHYPKDDYEHCECGQCCN